MLVLRWLRISTIALLLALPVGCAHEAPATAPVAPAPTTPSPEPTKLGPAQAESSRDQMAALAAEAEQPAVAEVKPAEAPKEPEFAPPYVDRDDVFKRPEINKVARADTSSRDSAVELKGFVDVAGLKALVTIDGLLTTVTQGDQRNGIEVIEVAPPKVIFQRGRVRWTESLFESQVQ